MMSEQQTIGTIIQDLLNAEPGSLLNIGGVTVNAFDTTDGSRWVNVQTHESTGLYKRTNDEGTWRWVHIPSKMVPASVKNP